VLLHPPERGIFIVVNGTDRIRVCHDGLLIPVGPADATRFSDGAFSLAGGTAARERKRGRRAARTICG
jgi:hypothetical protein